MVANKNMMEKKKEYKTAKFEMCDLLMHMVKESWTFIFMDIISCEKNNDDFFTKKNLK